MAQSLTTPPVITQPFANNGDKNTIPNTTDPTSGLASQSLGFGPINSQRIQDGGKAPRRADFNGIFNGLSQTQFFAQNGGTYTFNPAVSDAIGGYPLNAVLIYFPIDTTVRPYRVQSLKANNTDNFVNDPTLIDGVSWRKIEFTKEDMFDYGYDFRANSPRFIEAKILNTAYLNKTYIQMAVAGATNVFDKNTFVIHPCSIRLNVDGVDRWYIGESDVEITPTSILDTGTDLTAGKDYYIYLVPDGDDTKFVCSQNASYPSGYTATNSRKIGGFHTLCVAAGSLTNNIASGYSAAQIIPNSIWCLGFRPAGDTRGAAYIDVLDAWGHIYLQSGTGENTTSAYGATITDTRYVQAHIEDMLAIGYCLPGDSEFTAMAWGSNQQTNIAGSSDPVTTGGHNDTAGRRMISTYFLEDCCGALWQWMSCASANGGSGWNDISYTGGDFFGSCLVLLAGGCWPDGARCGWGSRYGVAGRSALDVYYSARGLSPNIRLTSKEI